MEQCYADNMKFCIVGLLPVSTLLDQLLGNVSAQFPLGCLVKGLNMQRVLAIVFLHCISISLVMGQGLQLPGPLQPPASPVPCTCGVFLTGQFVRGSAAQPDSPPVLLHEYDTPLPCNPLGTRQCASKCLEVIAKHLRNSGTIVCGSLDRDCFKERAYLWTKNCNDVWQNSNMSAGREFCCKDGEPYKCPFGNAVKIS